MSLFLVPSWGCCANQCELIEKWSFGFSLQATIFHVPDPFAQALIHFTTVPCHYLRPIEVASSSDSIRKEQCSFGNQMAMVHADAFVLFGAFRSASLLPVHKLSLDVQWGTIPAPTYQARIFTAIPSATDHISLLFAIHHHHILHYRPVHHSYLEYWDRHGWQFGQCPHKPPQ